MERCGCPACRGGAADEACNLLDVYRRVSQEALQREGGVPTVLYQLMVNPPTVVSPDVALLVRLPGLRAARADRRCGPLHRRRRQGDQPRQAGRKGAGYVLLDRTGRHRILAARAVRARGARRAAAAHEQGGRRVALRAGRAGAVRARRAGADGARLRAPPAAAGAERAGLRGRLRGPGVGAAPELPRLLLPEGLQARRAATAARRRHPGAHPPPSARARTRRAADACAGPARPAHGRRRAGAAGRARAAAPLPPTCSSATTHPMCR